MTGIVIVNYKTAELTVDFVGRELSKLPSPWRLVIVDAARRRRVGAADSGGNGSNPDHRPGLSS